MGMIVLSLHGVERRSFLYPYCTKVGHCILNYSTKEATLLFRRDLLKVDQQPCKVSWKAE